MVYLAVGRQFLGLLTSKESRETSSISKSASVKLAECQYCQRLVSIFGQVHPIDMALRIMFDRCEASQTDTKLTRCILRNLLLAQVWGNQESHTEASVSTYQQTDADWSQVGRFSSWRHLSKWTVTRVTWKYLVSFVTLRRWEVGWWSTQGSCKGEIVWGRLR